MIFADLMERSRSRTASKIKEAIAERAMHSKVHTEPAIRVASGALAFAPDGLKLPLRWDFVAEGDPEQKNADSITLKIVEPALATWAHDMRIELLSVCWDCMIFRLSPAREGEDWEWLKSWFMHWFDPGDKNEKNGDGLYQVVHFISDPEPAGATVKFIVDFGSAKIEAISDLLDRVSEQGYTTCVIGDEKQPNQSPQPTPLKRRG